MYTVVIDHNLTCGIAPMAELIPLLCGLVLGVAAGTFQVLCSRRNGGRDWLLEFDNHSVGGLHLRFDETESDKGKVETRQVRGKGDEE